MQEFPGPRIRQTFILEQIDNPNRLCGTINLRVKLRMLDKPEGQVSVGGQIIYQSKIHQRYHFGRKNLRKTTGTLEKGEGCKWAVQTLPIGGKDYNHDMEK